jgi:hypothetical protein
MDKANFVRDLGAAISSKDRNESLKELEIFQRRFKEQVFAPDENTGSTAIMLLPVGPGQPVYRDVVVPFVVRYGIDALNLGAFLKVPQLVVPSTFLSEFSKTCDLADFLYFSWAKALRVSYHWTN